MGVIPEDWNVLTLSEHFRIYAGGDVPKHSVSESRSEAHPYPIFANALQDQGLYGFTGERRSKAGSLTITARGYLGHAEYRDEDFFPIVRLLVLEPTDALDARFTTFAVNDRVKFAFESTGVPQLTAPQVAKYSIAAPPLHEQRAIATALSDVDALLAGLDKLIAKKRDLKQAAMQQLLTGQTRLPGFQGEWEVKRLGDICRITTGRKDVNEGNPNGQFPFFTCSRVHTFSDGYSFDTEAILIAGNGEVGNLHYFKGKFEAYQRTYILYDFSVQVSYLWQQLNAGLAESLGLGKIGSSIPYIKKENLTEFEFRSPIDTNEQTAIAAVLSDMDTELAALEARRDKTRALKQGMMQELLTGRTRLV
ncbi:MAG: restriction endonuclease subunit S [Gallionella sp.]|nr:restriction endonuclease subunit S [Gallionella sp.]MDD4947376.1 restriction endonuclease subunit S [Gallionella sp.]